MNGESLKKIDQQAESSLLRLHELWQSTHTLANSQQQPLTEALQEHYLSLEELQVVLEELRSQNQELITIRHIEFGIVNSEFGIITPRLKAGAWIKMLRICLFSINKFRGKELCLIPNSEFRIPNCFGQVLEVERQRYRELFDLAPEGYLVTDPEAIILEANQAAGKLLNCSPKRLIGKPLIVFALGESLPKFHTMLSQLQSSQKPQAWEVQIKPRNLDPFPGLFKVAIVQDSDGKVIGLRWLLQDISKRKQYEEALEMARSNLEQQVAERTTELAISNEQLKQEITERRRIEAALRQQNEWARLMMAMQARIRQSLNLEEILKTTVAEVRQFLGADRVVVYKVDSSRVASVVAESVDAACTSLLGIQIDTPLFKERVVFYRRGNPSVIHDMRQAEFPTAINQFLQQQQVKASLTVPILQGNKFWGLLAIHQCQGTRLWQPSEVELLQQLATQVSITIQQSELYQQVVQLNTNLESQVQQRTAQLKKSLDFEATLKRISDDVRDTLDEKQILQTAVWELAVVLNIHGCNTGLYDAEFSTSTISYEYKVGLDAAQGQVVQMQDFLEGYKQLLQGEYFQFCELVSSWQTPVAILACPIFGDQGTIGDLWLFKQPESAFDELELRLVQQVANQCAIAIRQARLYQAAQVKIQELETLNRLKDDFLNNVSHELRTPVANMNMAIQMLSKILQRDREALAQLTKTEAESSKVSRYLHILQNECERELNLIDSLLDLQNLSGNIQPSVLTSIQLQDWLPQFVEPFQARSHNYKQNLLIDISPHLPRLICEPSSLGRVLAELLNNACKYTPPGEKILVKAQAQSGMMQLSISNSGVEIPANEIPRIFEKFYRIRANDFWNQGGTGLGLALVQQLVKRLGGKISVESSAQQTCFTVELPLN